MFKTRFFSILALLLMAVSGAWADETPLVTINSTGYTTFTSGSKTFDDKVTVTFSNSVSNDGDHWGWYTDGTASLLTVAGINGYTITSCKFYTFDGTAKTGYTVAGESPSVYLNNDYVYTDDSKSENIGKFGISKIEVYGGVAPATVDVTGVTLSQTSADMTVGGDALTLTATVAPNDATDKTVTWTSSDESVATVADGVVTAVAAGTATITATATNGTADTSDDKTATCEVTVSPAGYSVALKEGTDDAANWQGKAGEGEYQSLPLTGLEAGTAVSVKYSGVKKVKSVKAKKKAAPAGPTYNETKSINDGPVTVAAGEHWLITGTGTQTTNTMSIGAGATVTLDGVNISSGDYCIRCLGDATIILKDGSTNTLTGTGSDYPALSIGDANTTLTIQGSTGVLNVQQNGDYCAGIGGGYSNTDNTCGNIRIEGGVITVQGGLGGAGIGSDAGGNCGDIIITGGTITANGGNFAAGIGCGDSGSCGTVTITDGVTSVTATKGNNADYSIGAGCNGSCGTVTIGGTGYGTDGVSTSPYTYQPSN